LDLEVIILTTKQTDAAENI